MSHDARSRAARCAGALFRNVFSHLFRRSARSPSYDRTAASFVHMCVRLAHLHDSPQCAGGDVVVLLGHDVAESLEHVQLVA